MYFFTLFTGWLAYLDKEAFGAHKGDEDDAYDGFGDHDDDESEDVEDDHANGAGAPGRPEPWGGGGNNKFTFRKVSQIVFSQGFASAKCMYFRKLSQICFRNNTKVSQAFASMISQAFASFRANSQIWFRSVSQAFAIHGFASFRKDSQGFANRLLQPFAKDSQVRKSWFFARIRNGHFADAEPECRLYLLRFKLYNNPEIPGPPSRCHWM